MKQDIFKFNFKFRKNEFFVTEKNFFAYEFMKSWPKWKSQLVFIYGPKKCGKSSIADIWKNMSSAIYVSKQNFNEIFSHQMDINYIKKNNWILDDIDKIIKFNNKKNSKKIFSLINIIKSTKESFLLMTSNKPPKYLRCELDDLTSRLQESIVIEVLHPDQELLNRIIQKYLNDRNIVLSDKCISYVSDRIERSYESALKIAKRIDLKSLETKSNISVYFLRSLFDE